MPSTQVDCNVLTVEETTSALRDIYTIPPAFTCRKPILIGVIASFPALAIQVLRDAVYAKQLLQSTRRDLANAHRLAQAASR